LASLTVCQLPFAGPIAISWLLFPCLSFCSIEMEVATETGNFPEEKNFPANHRQYLFSSRSCRPGPSKFSANVTPLFRQAVCDHTMQPNSPCPTMQYIVCTSIAYLELHRHVEQQRSALHLSRADATASFPTNYTTWPWCFRFDHPFRSSRWNLAQESLDVFVAFVHIVHVDYGIFADGFYNAGNRHMCSHVPGFVGPYSLLKYRGIKWLAVVEYNVACQYSVCSK